MRCSNTFYWHLVVVGATIGCFFIGEIVKKYQYSDSCGVFREMCYKVLDKWVWVCYNKVDSLV